MAASESELLLRLSERYVLLIKWTKRICSLLALLLLLCGCASTTHHDKPVRCTVDDQCGGEPLRMAQHAVDLIIYANFPEEAGRYTVVMWKDDELMNAGAGLGRKIHISTQLYEGLTWEQLMAVMAHEMAHHKLNHVYNGLLVNTAISVGHTVAVISNPALLLLPLGTVASALSRTAIDRPEEYQADIKAVEYLEKVGYGKEEYLSALIWLKDNVPHQESRSILSTHPHIDDRIKTIQSLPKSTLARLHPQIDRR